MDVACNRTTRSEDKHMKTHKYVGLDVHSVSTVIAVADGGRSGEVRLYGKVSSDLHALEKVLGKLGGENVVLHVVYEAGAHGICGVPAAAAAGH